MNPITENKTFRTCEKYYGEVIEKWSNLQIVYFNLPNESHKLERKLDKLKRFKENN